MDTTGTVCGDVTDRLAADSCHAQHPLRRKEPLRITKIQRGWGVLKCWFRHGSWLFIPRRRVLARRPNPVLSTGPRDLSAFGRVPSLAGRITEIEALPLRDPNGCDPIPVGSTYSGQAVHSPPQSELHNWCWSLFETAALCCSAVSVNMSGSL